MNDLISDDGVQPQYKPRAQATGTIRFALTKYQGSVVPKTAFFSKKYQHNRASDVGKSAFFLNRFFVRFWNYRG